MVISIRNIFNKLPGLNRLSFLNPVPEGTATAPPKANAHSDGLKLPSSPISYEKPSGSPLDSGMSVLAKLIQSISPSGFSPRNSSTSFSDHLGNLVESFFSNIIRF